MKKEFNKIKNSLELFANLAIIFLNSNSKECSEWRNDAIESIKYLNNFNLENILKLNMDDAKKLLDEKLPINKNKNKNRQYKNKRK